MFQFKDIEKRKWVSMSSRPRRKFFDLFTSNFKHFKELFFKVRAFEHEYPFFLDEKGYAKFSLYWNRFLKRVPSIDSRSLSQYEQVILNYLFDHLSSQKKALSCTGLLKWDTNRVEVLKHLSKFLLDFLFSQFLLWLFS